MKNYTWTTEYLTLEILPCGTIHMEQSGIDENDEEFLTFDKVESINVVDGCLILNAPGMIHEFPELGNQFLNETGNHFKISDLIPTPPLNIISGVWTEEGKPIEVLFIQNDQLKLRQTTPGDDRIETVLS